MLFKNRRNVVALGIFVVFYISFGTYLTLAQERVVYLPFPQDFASCPAFHTAQKVTHQGTRMYVADGPRGTVVLYHGNAGSACDRAWYASLFAEAGYGYVIVEYAGYSNDTVSPSHARIREDVAHVTDYLRAHTTNTVLVVGESIGTGMAALHTSLAPPEALLLISPFTTLPAVAHTRFWYYPTSLLVTDACNNPTLLAHYRGNVTIMHGAQDTLIPHRLGRALYDGLSTTRKTFVSIPGSGHNDLYDTSEFETTMHAFLDEHTESQATL